MSDNILSMIDKITKKINENKDNKFIDLKLINKSTNACTEALEFEKLTENNAKKLIEIINKYKGD